MKSEDGCRIDTTILQVTGYLILFFRTTFRTALRFPL